VALDALRPLEEAGYPVAAADREPGVREVVVRVRLGQRVRPAKREDGLAEERQRSREVACLHAVEALASERSSVRSLGRRGCCRRSSGGRPRDRRRPAGPSLGADLSRAESIARTDDRGDREAEDHEPDGPQERDPVAPP